MTFVPFLSLHPTTVAILYSFAITRSRGLTYRPTDSTYVKANLAYTMLMQTMSSAILVRQTTEKSKQTGKPFLRSTTNDY